MARLGAAGGAGGGPVQAKDSLAPNRKVNSPEFEMRIARKTYEGESAWPYSVQKEEVELVDEGCFSVRSIVVDTSEGNEDNESSSRGGAEGLPGPLVPSELAPGAPVFFKVGIPTPAKIPAS